LDRWSWIDPRGRIFSGGGGGPVFFEGHRRDDRADAFDALNLLFASGPDALDDGAKVAGARVHDPNDERENSVCARHRFSSRGIMPRGR
jgi:hypothetical protein